MNTYRTLTREARATCAILAIGILALLWAIQFSASQGDGYGTLGLALALCVCVALGTFIVTSELRDDNAKQLRARMSRLHTQQVNTLSDAIVKLETHNDQLSTIARDMNKSRITANAEYRQLRAQLETLTRGAPVVTEYTHSASTALMLGTLDKAYALANGETVYPLA